jgi:hypothetical protein
MYSSDIDTIVRFAVTVLASVLTIAAPWLAFRLLADLLAESWIGARYAKFCACVRTERATLARFYTGHPRGLLLRSVTRALARTFSRPSRGLR